MSEAINTVRALIGRRHRITQAEMVAILMALPMDLPNGSTITARDPDGRLFVGSKPVARPSEEAQATAQAWAALCKGITCISVLRTGYYVGDEMRVGLGVRHDEPGSMHPLQLAEVTFISRELGDDSSSYSYLRTRCKRLLIVEAS